MLCLFFLKSSKISVGHCLNCKGIGTGPSWRKAPDDAEATELPPQRSAEGCVISSVGGRGGSEHRTVCCEPVESSPVLCLGAMTLHLRPDFPSRASTTSYSVRYQCDSHCANSRWVGGTRKKDPVTSVIILRVICCTEMSLSRVARKVEIASGDWSLGRERWHWLGDREHSSLGSFPVGTRIHATSFTQSRMVGGVCNRNGAPLDVPLLHHLTEKKSRSERTGCEEKEGLTIL